jgi:hypothetical protein
MFYEQNSSVNNHNHNSNGFHQPSSNASRRSTFQQSTSTPSTNKTFQSSIARAMPSKSSLVSSVTSYKPTNNMTATIITGPTTTSNTCVTDRMQRSKSYKDLFDPPASSSATTHQAFYQPQSCETRSNQLNHSSMGDSPATTGNVSSNLFPYYSSSFYYSTPNGTNSASIVGSMLSNASTNRILDQSNQSNGVSDGQRWQQLLQQASSTSNLLLDDISSSSTASHLPKPPPGMPSQHARYGIKSSIRI